MKQETGAPSGAPVTLERFPKSQSKNQQYASNTIGYGMRSGRTRWSFRIFDRGGKAATSVDLVCCSINSIDFCSVHSTAARTASPLSKLTNIMCATETGVISRIAGRPYDSTEMLSNYTDQENRPTKIC